MSTKCIQAGILTACIVGGLAAQVPIGPPQSVYGCLRPDVAKNTAALRQSMAKGDTTPVPEAQIQMQGCTSYTVAFQSSLQMVFKGPGGGTAKISGKGAITFGLAPDVSEPDFDFTSGPSELTAPIYWSNAEITRGNGCIVTTVPLPYTPFSFWLGVRSGPDPRVSVQVSGAGDELHNIATRCPKPRPLSGWVDGPPGEKESIFTPAWIFLHGQGVGGAAGVQPPTLPSGAMDPAAMKALAAKQQGSPMMDPAKLQAMAAQLGKNPSPADMMKMVNQLVPNAGAMVEAARNNFTFKLPGDCVQGGPLLTRCTVNRTVTVPDGKGATQEITESTVITITKLSAGAAKP